MKIFVLTLCGLGTALLLSAQPCATLSGAAVLDISLDKNAYPGEDSGIERHSWKKALRGHDAIFEIQFYTILAESAPETLPPGAIEDALNQLNRQFDESGITFRQTGTPLDVTDAHLADFNRSQTTETKLHRQKRSGPLINVFIVDFITDGYVRGYTYNPYVVGNIPANEEKRNMIVLTREGILDNSTLAHEMGHFFGLFHTHENHQGEKPDLPEAENCAQTGDYVCDTPPSPNMSDLITYDCLCKDFKGDIHLRRYQLSMENIMSYSWPHCRTRFTEGQRYRMLQCAHLKRQDLIVGTVRDNGSAERYMIPLTLSKAFEFNYQNGGPRKALIFVHNEGANFSRRMYHELAEMIDKTSAYANVVPQGGGFTLAVYDTDRPDTFTKDFIGNVLFHQNESTQQREFDWLLTMLQKSMAQYPALFVLRLERTRGADFLKIDYIPGYLKPRELLQLLDTYDPVKPLVLGK